MPSVRDAADHGHAACVTGDRCRSRVTDRQDLSERRSCAAHFETSATFRARVCGDTPSPGRADSITIDQSQTEAGHLASLINECCRYVAQTFTAGIAGSLLGVTVDVFENENVTFPLSVRLSRVSDMTPTLETLAEAVVQSGHSGITDRILFDRAVPQRPGDRFAIVLSYDTAPLPGGGGTGIGTWSGELGNLYPRGVALLSIDGRNWFTELPDADSAFSTLVATPTPEPATGASVAMVLGLVAAWSQARGRRRRTLLEARESDRT